MADFTHRTVYDHFLDNCLRSQLLAVALLTCHCLKFGNDLLQQIICILFNLPSSFNFRILALDPLVIVLEKLVLDQGFLDRKLVHFEDLVELPRDLRFLLLDKLLFLLLFLGDRLDHGLGAVDARLASQVK